MSAFISNPFVARSYVRHTLWAISRLAGHTGGFQRHTASTVARTARLAGYLSPAVKMEA